MKKYRFVNHQTGEVIDCIANNWDNAISIVNATRGDNYLQLQGFVRYEALEVDQERYRFLNPKTGEVIESYGKTQKEAEVMINETFGDNYFRDQGLRLWEEA